jgi:hypothetical protein
VRNISLRMNLSVMAFVMAIASQAIAHPVSYKGAIGIMSYNNQKMNEVLLTYSFSPHFALAGTYLKDSKSEFLIPRADLLLHRWNNEDSQGNFYLSAGAGIEKFNSEKYGVKLGEVVADWESRKYYTYFEHLYLKRDNDLNSMIPWQDYNHTKFRLGFAPFLADYHELNVWYILQAEQHNDEKQNDLTQFLRFYRKNVLWEIGAGFDGSIALNLMIHL